MSKYQAQYKVHAIIGVPLKSETLTEGVEEAATLTKNKFSFQLAGVELLDGHEELIGVTGDWNLDA